MNFQSSDLLLGADGEQGPRGSCRHSQLSSIEVKAAIKERSRAKNVSSLSTSLRHLQGLLAGGLVY